MKSGSPGSRFSYAEDIGILGFGRTITESVAAVQSETDHLLEWAGTNAVDFDTEKSEVIQFPGRRRGEAVGLHVNGNPIEPADHIRWLGVNMDP